LAAVKNFMQTVDVDVTCQRSSQNYFPLYFRAVVKKSNFHIYSSLPY